jgi:hypothetical protein
MVAAWYVRVRSLQTGGLVFGRRKKDWLRGTARVVGVTRPPHAATHGRLVADVVVEAPGLPAYATEYKEMVVSVSKWPGPGEVLPVLVNPKDHTDLDVLWDEVKTGDEVSRERAEQIAEAMRTRSDPTALSSPAGPGAVPGAGVDAAIVDTLRQMFPEAQVTIGSEVPSAPPGGSGLPPTVVASQSTDDPIVRLEKLAALHASGIVDDVQFAALRAQILEQAGLD